MLFRQLFESESCTYTYLLATHEGEALLIDPVIEQLASYKQLLGELGLTLKMSIDTHTHADHITASGLLRQETGCEHIMGARTQAIDCVSRTVEEGDRITLGSINLDVLYTPGHTDDSYSFVGNDRVFTGDVLMIRATGRTDFQKGDAALSYHSIVDKLFKLPKEYYVYPAHDYKGWTVSTIAEEQAHNPRLKAHTLEEYIKIMGELNLPRPKKIDVAVPANQQCGLSSEQLSVEGLARQG